MTLPGFPDAQPVQGLIGGVLIGLAAALMLLGAGRIAGVSGILARGTRIAEGDMAQTSAWGFLLGLPLGALLVRLATDWQPAVFADWPVLAVAGVLVGFGTRMGSGCTSGHGVCGLGRLSPRSLVAVVTFMGTAIVTTFLIRHVWS